jgi:serine/threonine protein kinase
MWLVGQTVVIDFMGNQEFVVVKHIQGGMGDIFKVVDPKFHCIAIKTLQPAINPSAFTQECEMLISASKGYACVKPIAYGVIDGHPAIAYHWYPTTLSDQNAEFWDASSIVKLITELAEFFNYACSQIGILHCDIKPANILLDRENKPHVSDFGISRLISTNLESGVTKAAGTPAYMAPELAFTGVHTVKSELYSFGITIYEFLTGENPYHNDFSISAGAKRVQNNFKRLRKKVGEKNAFSIEFIERCISLEQGKRPMSFELSKNSASSYIVANERKLRTLVDSIGMQSVYLRKQGNFIEAEKLLHDAFRVHGRHPALLNALGNLYAETRSHAAATVPLEEATNTLLGQNARIDSLPYYDPIINLSMHYRCLGRHKDSYNVLAKAWESFCRLDNPPYLYAEFAWMHNYAGNYLFACSYAESCFQKRAIQPFEMLFFTQAAWSCCKLKKYADLILSKVIYNQQFEGTYFLSAFILATYACDSSIRRMYEHLDEKSIQQIRCLEQDGSLATSSLRPPLDPDIQRLIITDLDYIVTGGRHAAFIQQH